MDVWHCINLVFLFVRKHAVTKLYRIEKLYPQKQNAANVPARIALTCDKPEHVHIIVLREMMQRQQY